MKKKTLLALSYLLIISLFFSCSEKLNVDPSKTSKSNEKAILKFSFQNLTPAVQGTIDEASKKIKVNVSISTNITSLAPSIVISKNATIDPDSGKVQNFTSPVIYTVTAQDKSTQQYSVEVTKQMTSNGIIFFANLSGGVFGVDIVTGKQVWEWKATSAINNTNIGGSPLIDNDVLYCSFGGVLCAVDIKTKKSKWEIRTSNYFTGTPVIKDGVLLISSYKEIIAYNALTGTKIWGKLFNKFGTSAPTMKDEKVYVGGDGNLHALDYKSGKLIFEIKLNNDSTELGNPIVDNNAIYFNDGRGNIYTANGNTGTIEWSKKFCYYPAATSMAISNGTLYGFCTATLYALNTENGEKKWSFTPNQNFNFLYAPEISNNKIYTVLTSIFGGYSIYQIDAENGKESGSWDKNLKTKNPLLATPELTYYIFENELIAINNLGEKVWTYKLTSSGISLVPLVLLGNDGKTYYSSMTGMKN